MNGKQVAFCTIGFLIGAGAGYAMASFLYENMVDEEEELFEDEEELEEEEVETVLPTEKRIQKKRVNYTDMYKGKEKPNLETLAKQIRDGIENDEEAIVEEVLDENPDPSKPYLITREKFEEELLQTHKKVYYHYYDDGILTQAEDEIVITAQPDKFLGPDALDSFGLTELDPDFVHVRNEILGVDYEIQLIHGSFEKKISKRPERVKKQRPEKFEEGDDE